MAFGAALAPAPDRSKNGGPVLLVVNRSELDYGKARDQLEIPEVQRRDFVAEMQRCRADQQILNANWTPIASCWPSICLPEFKTYLLWALYRNNTCPHLESQQEARTSVRPWDDTEEVVSISGSCVLASKWKGAGIGPSARTQLSVECRHHQG